MSGVLAGALRSGSADAPGVVVALHEGFGLTRFVARQAAALAATGVEVIAPALYWREPPLRYGYHDEAAAGARARALDLGAAAEDVWYAAAAVAAGRPVAAVGWCLGGVLAVQLATDPGPLAAAAAYYPVRVGSSVPAGATPRVQLLIHVGADDEFLTDADRSRLAELCGTPGVDCRTYPSARHGFANPDRPERHDADATASADDTTVSFLRRSLGLP